MSEMVERVAAAVRRRRIDLLGNTPSDTLDAPSFLELELARVAIEAMREPTPEMRIKGGIGWVEALPESETYVDTSDACWKAMIDAALTHQVQQEG